MHRVLVALLLLGAFGCSAPAASTPAGPTSPPAAAKPTTAPAANPTVAPTAAAGVTSAGAAATPAAAGADPAAAKAEGSVSWYTSTPQNLADKIAQMFEQQSGIKVQVFRSGGEAVMQRFLAEQDAGRTAADVITTSDQAAFMQLASQGKLLPYKPAGFDMVLDSARDKDGAWISQRLSLYVPIYRADKVSDTPKSWKDLASPRFKGQLIITDPAFSSTSYLLVQTLASPGLLGWDYFKQLADNDMMIVQGNAQVAQALQSGERTVALGADTSALVSDIQKGDQIKLSAPEEGSFLITAPEAILAKAPHPNAAKAFTDFMFTTQVQSLFANDGIHAARTDIPAPKGFPELKSIKVIPIDYDAAAKDNKTVKDQFAEIFH
jgi:iron(III) transport system substrate-binding protein